MRDRLGRRRALKHHPGLGQVDRLLAGSPDELEVPISGLPGQLAALYSLYEGLFELRDYRVKAVDRRLDDLWIARFTKKGPTAGLATGSGLLGSVGRR